LNARDRNRVADGENYVVRKFVLFYRYGDSVKEEYVRRRCGTTRRKEMHTILKLENPEERDKLRDPDLDQG
jgi:hypothetical protein